MKSFRKSILLQIESIAEGRIFTFADLDYSVSKAANVAVLLSEQCKKGLLVRIERGAYYRPAKSSLGLGYLPVYYDEQIRYLTEKMEGYITGVFAYNKMGLTEQVPNTVTIATKNPVRHFKFKNLNVECVKSYYSAGVSKIDAEYLRVLDAIRQMKHVPGATEQDVYTRVKSMYFEKYSMSELDKIVNMAKSYPPRVRNVVADMLEDIGQASLMRELKETLLPTTHFNMNYRKSCIA